MSFFCTFINLLMTGRGCSGGLCPQTLRTGPRTSLRDTPTGGRLQAQVRCGTHMRCRRGWPRQSRSLRKTPPQRNRTLPFEKHGGIRARLPLNGNEFILSNMPPRVSGEDSSNVDQVLTKMRRAYTQAKHSTFKPLIYFKKMVAGVGFEPTTFRL